MDVVALSFGGGVQTAALALMLEAGDVPAPRPDVAIFADTGAEPPHVYQTLDWIRPMLSSSRRYRSATAGATSAKGTVDYDGRRENGQA